MPAPGPRLGATPAPGSPADRVKIPYLSSQPHASSYSLTHPEVNGIMWIVFSIVLVLWMLSVHFYMPVPIILGLFAALVGCATVALIPVRRSEG